MRPTLAYDFTLDETSGSQFESVEYHTRNVCQHKFQLQALIGTTVQLVGQMKKKMCRNLLPPLP